MFILAEAAPTTPPQWWQVAAGIIAIPAGVIGLVYSWFLVQKTRLETAKLAAEIAEKVKAAQTATEASPAGQTTREAVLQATVPLLILRYVLMHLLWTLWGYASGAITFLLQGIGLGIYYGVGHKDLSNISSMWMIIPGLIVGKIGWVGDIFIFMAVGWPLFKDLNAIFNVNVRKIFFWWRRNG